MVPMDTKRLSVVDLAGAVVLAVVLVALYGSLAQTRLFGDGPGLVGPPPAGQELAGIHFGYQLALGLFRDALPGLSRLAAAKWFSALCGGLGVSCIFLLARALGLAPLVALGAALLAATSPVLVFFATTVEVHTLQLLAVGIGALCVVLAPWRRPVLASLVAGLGLSLAFQAHELSLLLGPGWLALAVWAAHRDGVDFSVRRIFFALGPALLGIVILTAVLVQVGRGHAASATATTGLDVMLAFQGAVSLGTFLRVGFLVPLMGLAVLPLLGLRRGLFDPRLRLALLLLVLVPFGFLLWWRVPERGAYMIGSLPFLAMLAARGLAASPAPRLAFPAVLLVQLGLAAYVVDDYDQGLDPSEHFELVRDVTGGHGTLLTALALTPSLDLDLPDLDVLEYQRSIRLALEAGTPPDVYGQQGLTLVRTLAAENPGLFEEGLYLDTSLDLLPLMGIGERMEPYCRAFEAALRAHFELVETQRAEWRIARIRP